MKKVRVYTDYEIKKLMTNPNVDGIKNKSQIIYNPNFKLWVVKEKILNPEKTARQLFESGGFDMNIIDDRTPQRRVCSWVKKYKMFGSEYFTKDRYTYKTLEENKKVYVIKIADDNLVISKGDN